MEDESYDVGVIVGRFQVAELTEAHRQIIQTVCDKHKHVIIFLGLSPLMSTARNPLPFEPRKRMILDAFPQVTVLYAKDTNNDEVWVSRFEEQIKAVTTPKQSVLLYGGRDSFIRHYEPFGNYETRELDQIQFFSGTEMRRRIGKQVMNSLDFRAGMIAATQNQFPRAVTTVDVAVFDEDYTRILLVRKPLEEQYRFCGGFSTPESATFEQDARREVQEEMGIEITDPKYFGSFKIDDWRYRQEADKIKSILFTAKYMFGQPRAADDVAEVKWFEIDSVHMTDIVPEHRNMMYALRESMKKAPVEEAFDDGAIAENTI
jgi:bifunctional NMN adenylyltransferase/nudix hydrolase